MRNAADVTGGKPIAVLLQSISGASPINTLVAFYDIQGGKREVLFFYFVPGTTRDLLPFQNVGIEPYLAAMSLFYQLYKLGPLVTDYLHRDRTNNCDQTA
jgi:hypothetical protein